MEAADEFEYFSEHSQFSTLERTDSDVKVSWQKELDTLKVWEVNRDNGQSAEYNNVRQELYNSERTYITYLLSIQKLFVNPLAHLPRLVKKTDLRTLFGEITSIYNVNKELLYELRVCPSISVAFNRLGPFLKLYTAYARNYSDSQKIFNKLMYRTDFRDFVEQQEKDPFCNGVKFSALMIMPIQRVPRYVLLLKRLEEETCDIEEKSQLKEVLKEMFEITGLIESCIRDFENGERLWSIQESLGLKEDIVAPGRRLLKEGSLFKRSHCGEATYHERLFWLFNDILVYGKRRLGMGPKYECSCIFPLRHCQLDYNEIDGSLLIRCKAHSVLVTSESYDTLKTWFEEIGTAVDRTKILRSTLRKESSRQQVKEFKSQIKKNLTKKFINKTYLYDMRSSRRQSRLEAKTKKWEEAASCSTDVDVQLSPPVAPPVQRKRKGDSEFDIELRSALYRRRIDGRVGDDSATECSSRSGRLPLQSTRNQQDIGVDEPDRAPKTRSRAREELQKEMIVGTLSHPEIRKYSYQEPSAPDLCEESSSSAEENSAIVDETTSEFEKGRNIPWWVVESTPAMYAKRREKRSLVETVRNSCSIM